MSTPEEFGGREAVNHPEKPAPLRVKTFFDVTKAHEDLRFSDTDLTGAMMSQAGMFAYYGSMLSRATRQVEEFERVIGLTEAKLDRKVRDRLSAEGVKITEAGIEKEIRRHPMMEQLQKALIEAKEVENNAKAIVEAFRHRRDMLVQIGATSREELKGELRMSSRNIADHAARAGVVEALSRHKD